MNETGNGNKERNNAKIRKGENGSNVKSLVTSFIFTSEKRIKRIFLFSTDTKLSSPNEQR